MTNSENEQQAAVQQPGCGIFGRYPLVSLLIFASLGVGCGIGLSTWEDDGDGKDTLIKWIGLLGDLFVRALKCLVLPLIFVSITLAVLDMMRVGRAGSVGWKTIVCYLSTTAIASIIGIISISMFKSTFSEGKFEPGPPPTVELGCEEEGMYLTEFPDGTVACAPINGTLSQFFINDVTNSFSTSSGGPAADVSMSDTVYDGIFLKIVPSNIFVEFNDANFAAIVFFAVIFAMAINQVYLVAGGAPREEGETVIRFFKALDKVFLRMIQWVIMLTPFAVFSLITQAIGSQDDIKEAFSNVGYLIVAFIVGIIMQFVLVHIIGFYAITRRNPFEYLKCIVPAQTMAFACASSAATVPVTLKSVRSTGWVPEPILRFVVPLGATVNMDGSAIYYPMASVWLAYLNGIEPTPADMILLVILGTLGSIGAAPVPYSSLVLIITAYNTVFGGDTVPEGVAFLAGIDWFIGMLRTVTNVTGDAVVCGLVAHMCPIEDAEEMEGVMDAAELEKSPDATVHELDVGDNKSDRRSDASVHEETA